MARVRYVRSVRLEAVIARLVELLALEHVRIDRVFCAVSFGSKSRAYARIWGLPGPFVRLGVCEPAYVVELIYENVASLPCSKLLGVLVHELLHIPRSFSGGLRSHGDWSRWHNISSLVASIEAAERRRLCRETRAALREALEYTGARRN